MSTIEAPRKLPGGLRSRFSRIVRRLIPHNYYLRAAYWEYWLRGRHDEELSYINHFARTYKRAVDIGANLGHYSYHLSRQFACVEAFEPNGACAGVLRTCPANVRVHEMGLSATTGEMHFYVPLFEGKEATPLGSLKELSGAHVVKTVRVARLDDFEFRDVSFIKIDVEGHELEVLKGAAETLRLNRPVILMEIEQRHAVRPISDVFDWLASASYDGYFILHGVKPLTEFSHAEHQAAWLAGDRSKKYVNNFFFVPRNS